MQDPNLSLFHLALKNAELFIQDAQILLDSGSVGHSYGLSVLAFEEFGKALMGFNCYLGVLNRDDEEFKIMFKDHSEKQMTAFQIISMLILIEYLDTTTLKNQINKIITELQKDIISYERYINDFIDILEIDDSEFAENLLRLLEIEVKFIDDPRWMDKRKQRALYVDLDKKDPRILLTPQDEYEFSKEEVQLVITSHKWFIEYWREIDIELRKKKRLPVEFVKYRQAVKKIMKELN